MSSRHPRTTLTTLRFHKLVRAPLRFVYQWCTDYRDDDDRITDSIYHYKATIILREASRIVRTIVVPGSDRNQSTDVEIISLRPPNRWSLRKFSVTDDETATYRLTRKGVALTRIDIRIHRTWKLRNPPNRTRYRALFNQVWDRYVTVMEQEFRGRRAG